MSITFGDHISKAIKQIASNATDPIYFASAFCRSSAFARHFSGLINHQSKKTLIVRWRLGDFVSGASDLDTFAVATELGWDLYMNSHLHAKALFTGKNAIISSANMTDRGMAGSPPQGNYELGVCIEETETSSLQTWFDQIIEDSRLMDDELFQQLSSEVQGHLDSNPIEQQKVLEFSSETKRLIDAQPNFRLYTQDLFWTASPSDLFKLSTTPEARKFIEHDLMLLRLSRPFDQQDVSNAFSRCPAFRWLKSKLSSEMYFGELTAALHEDLADDPAPYRQEIKGLLSNLLQWSQKLAPTHIQVDRPNHSQRIKLTH